MTDPVRSSRCPACTGHGQAFVDEFDVVRQTDISIHISCGVCFGSGLNVRSAAEAVHAEFWTVLSGSESRKYARERIQTIARIMAAHLRDTIAEPVAANISGSWGGGEANA